MKKRKSNNHLAEGEATGHYHEAKGVSVAVFEGAFDDDSLLLVSGGSVEVEHQEHKTVVLPAGKYRTGRVLEFDPASEESREVQD